tara:strand:- start:801 stop:1022 length:222 start_codon:yes stop_codon:yes gene_type:complete
MLKRLRKFVYQKIIAGYNKNVISSNTTHEDAAFMTFLDLLYSFIVALFCIFTSITFYLFVKVEILPLVVNLIP